MIRMHMLFSLVAVITIVSHSSLSQDLRSIQKRVPAITAVKLGKTTYSDDGKTRTDIVAVSSILLHKTVYYKNGKVASDGFIKNKMYDGVWKIYYNNGDIMKEIKFKNNIVLSYVSYKNGRVWTKISEDRKEIFNKGNRLGLAFRSYFEVDQFGVIYQYKGVKELVDALSVLTGPEEISQILNDKFEAFLKGKGAGGPADVMNCGGGQQSFDSKGADLGTMSASTNAPASGQGSASSKLGSISSITSTISKPKVSGGGDVGKLIDDILGNCGGSSGGSGGGSGTGGSKGGVNGMPNIGGLSATQESARQQFKNMVDNCNSSGGGLRSPSVGGGLKDKSMIAAEPGAGEHGVGETVAHVAIEHITFSAVQTGLVSAAEALASPLLECAAIVAEGVAEPILVGVAAYKISDATVGAAVNDMLKSYQDSKDADAAYAAFSQQYNAEKERQEKEYQDYLKEKAANDAKTTPPSTPPPSTGSTAPSGTQPTPPSSSAPSKTTPNQEASDPCASMRFQYERCEQSGWRDYHCTEILRLLSHCGTDPKFTDPLPSGEVGVECHSKEEKDAEAARQRCAKLGLIAMPDPSGSGTICPSRDKLGSLPSFANPEYTDPVPDGPMANLLSTNNAARIDETNSASMLTGTKPTIIVFMSANCPASRGFLSTLFSPGMKSSLANYDVKVIEVSQNSKLVQDHNIQYLPTVMKVQGGKITDRKVGNMTVTETQLLLK